MLGAALLTGLLQGHVGAPSMLAALTMLASVALVGGAIHRRVRGNGNAQLAAAVGLAVSGFPVALAGGVSLSRAALTSLAWVVVFLSSALLVRAAFARASTRSTFDAIWIEAAAIGLAAFANFGFSLAGARSQAFAAGLTAVAAAAIAAQRPNVKQLKPVGLALAGLAAVAAFALAI
jgi:hypothetical protein